jgi:hypothetical protein
MAQPAQTGFSPVFIDSLPVIPESRYPVPNGQVFSLPLCVED